jgi:hypothetical protein
MVVTKKDLEGSGRGLFEILSRNLPKGAEGNHDDLDQDNRCPTEIRAEHRPTKSQNCYH